uniref:Signal transducer and activator of transcription n=1 Tax=Oryzias sinensis TaxID=183150 RepID=A0A8C7YVQ9_9TELE
MSQWKQIQQLEMRLLEHVDYLYDDNFPMDIRQGLASWIESQDWDTAVNDESMAGVLLTNLLSQLEKLRSQEQNFLQRHNMKIIQQQLQVLVIRHLNHSNTSSYMQNLKLFFLQLMDQAVKYIEDMQDDFDFRYKTLQSRGELNLLCMFANRERHVRKRQHHDTFPPFQEVLSKMGVLLKEIDDLMTSQLNPELQDWKRRQQIAAIGGPLLTGLEQLQSWFTLTAQSLFQTKRQLDKLGELIVKVTYESDPIPLQKPQLEEKVKYLIYHLIKSSFVVEKQPCMPTHPQKPLIIKTGVQFTTKVRYCYVKKDLLIYYCRSSCCILQGLLSVTEELHSLSFEACFTVQGLTIDLETCSLPLVVISNVSQLPGGWASVMWYNLLTDDPRNLGFFGNPPRANWSQLSEVLSWQFSTFAGRGLNKEQLSMLGEKLLGQHVSCGDFQISWSRFSKENIPGKPFSFWMWLDSILELIKKHLLPVWNENYIMGFVSKEMERALLKDREPGTFLLRFSESHLGGITFTWVEHSDSGEVKFNSVEPYTKNRLSALPFADIIRDYKVISDGVVPENPLKFLYPDIPKDEAFGRLYNSQPSKVHPYIPSTLIPISELR